MIKVIGAGFGRTGTMSLKGALELLGFDKCYHMIEVRQNPEHTELWRAAHMGQVIDWDTLFAGYQASVDWPSCNLWREQLTHFPNAKVILSRREPDAWYDSVMNTIYPITQANLAADDPERRAAGEWAMEIIWQPLFDGKMDDRAHVIAVYNQHNQAVMDELDESQLLVFDPKQGWEPLCEFLDVPTPAEAYPKTNTTEQFQAFMNKT